MSERTTIHGIEELGFDPDQLLPYQGSEGEPVADRLPPGWWYPMPSIPEASRLPEHWLGWLLTTPEPGPQPPMGIWEEWQTRKRMRAGYRLFWSPLRGCWANLESPGGRKPCPDGNAGKFMVGWVLVPDPPLYGAHRLEGFPPVQNSEGAKKKHGVMQPKGLRWVPWPDGEERAARKRKRMRNVWPNVLTFDVSQNRIVAIPWSSMVGLGSDESIVDDVPLYPFAPDMGPNIIDPIRLAGLLPVDPMQNGAIQSAVIERGSIDDVDLARALDNAVSMGDREKVLRDRIGMGRMGTLAVLRDPAGWRMLLAQYPDPIRYAEQSLPNTRIQRIIRLLRLVLLRALPALDQQDIDREQPEAERQFKIGVVRGLLNHQKVLGLAVPSWWTGPNEAVGNQRRFLTYLIRTEKQADDAIRVLSRGWSARGFDSVASLARSGTDSFDEALQLLAAWRGAGEEAIPYYRSRLVDWLQRGLDVDTLRAAWAFDRQTRSTGGQWMLALGIALVLQHLPAPESV